ncbi:MAG: ABC transporter ATP-binding protein [Candidatus Pacebacteria bacterium]|nr:ABC transporter ATP-binding protein [Candidatus Paceibacterota bacterium]
MKNKAPLIELRDLEKTYFSPGGDYTALKGINLKIKSGEFVALMGPSGSGKSTLMHIIGALDIPTKGKYLLKGKDIGKYTSDQLAGIRNKEIGFVFQTFNLLPRTTVFANVEKPLIYADVPKQQRVKRAMDSIAKVGLTDKAQNLSNHISGGQIQRVAIARALVMNPNILLADEPTGNLDTQTAKEIMVFIRKLNNQGHTIVLITHEKEIANYAKRIIKLRDGKIESDKPHKQKKYASK